MYTLWRNQHKFEKRCTSKRHAITTDVFRLDIVELMVDARQRLVSGMRAGAVVNHAPFVTRVGVQIKPKADTKLRDAKGEPVWTDREILGLGKVKDWNWECVAVLS